MVPTKRLLDGWWGVVAAALAGGLLPLAFAPFGWVALAVLSPAVLFYVAALAPRRRAIQAGFAFGLAQFGVGVSWVFVSIHDYGGSGVLLSALVTVGFVVLLALFPLLCVVLARWATPVAAYRLLFALPAAWLLLEWSRTWVFTGFPWLFLGYATLDSPLAGLAPLVGVLGGSAALAALAGLLAWWGQAPTKRRALWVTAVVAGVVAVAQLADRPWSVASGEPLSVALIQGNFSQEIKWQPAYRGVIRERYARMTVEHAGADLVVWPETAIPEIYDRLADDYLEPLADSVRRAGGTLVLGVPHREAGGADPPLYNSVVVLNEAGPSFYYKRHLVPYGEYVPLREWVGRRLDFLGAPLADYRRGPPATALSAGEEVRLGVTICYEVAYPRAVARTARDADLLVNVSNDAWFGDSLAPHQHLQKARQRAAETRRWLLRATNTGISAVIDPFGQVVHVGPQFEAIALTAEVEPRSGTTPYVLLGDVPVVLLALFVWGGVAIGGRWRRGVEP